jgi:hypothetical protein
MDEKTLARKEIWSCLTSFVLQIELLPYLLVCTIVYRRRSVFSHALKLEVYFGSGGNTEKDKDLNPKYWAGIFENESVSSAASL